MSETNKEDYNAELYFKMAQEQDRFREELMSMPAEEILKHAYEYTIREDILLSLENNDISDKQAQALLKSQHPLADVFDRWEHHESHHMEEIQDMIECRANEVMRAEFLKSKKQDRGR